MTAGSDDSRGRLVGRPWFVVGLALALAATLSLVLADDVRYLRLGIVAALWAALVGAFLAVRYRRHATTTEEAVAQAQEVYELELEREIAARREFELEIESETRSNAEAESRAELDALRAEVLALRDSLQSLFGGEVLLERVALTAQATRMRALREEGRLVEAPGNSRVHAQLTAAPAKESSDRPTELIERVRDKQPTRGRPAALAPEPRRPERSLDLPPRRATKNEPARPGQNRSSAAASVSKAAAEARADRMGQPPSTAEQTRVTVEPTRIGQPVRPRRAPAEPAKPAWDPGNEPTQLSKVLDPDWKPSSDNGSKPAGMSPASNGTSAPEQEPIAEQPKRAEAARPRTDPPRRFEPPPVERAERSRPRLEPAKPRIQPVARVEPSRPRSEPASAPEPPRVEPSPVAAEMPPPSNPTLPVEVRRRAQEGGAGGRRRKQEAPPETPAETSGPPASGGRRRRADDEPPAWQGASAGRATGSHAKPDLSAEPEGRRAAPAESPGRRVVGEETGSHAAGRSVSDLLAAHGAQTEATPRRRRRAED